jgi:hypothetical protein
MTQEYTKLEINCETKEEKIIPMNEQEIADFLKLRQEAEEIAAQEKAAAEAKEAARVSATEKLAALGLTPEEVAALSK